MGTYCGACETQTHDLLSANQMLSSTELTPQGVVAEAGLEPSTDIAAQGILSPSCLPIPSFGHNILK